MVFFLGTKIQYVGAGEKLVIADLVPFDVEAEHAEIKHETAESCAGDKYTQFLGWVVCLFIHEGLDNRSIGSFSFSGPFG
jgi:hypothetical protein